MMAAEKSSQKRSADVRIVTMTSSDLTWVAKVERESFADPWSRALFESELEEREQNYPRIALHRGERAGYMISWFVADEVHLGNIAVAPEWRGHGIADALLDDLIREGKLRDSSYIVLEVRESNEAAIRLYQRYGFDVMAVRRGYYQNNGEDALIMIRMLREPAEADLEDEEE
jgi:ribosomal-protein-alanine N-acetyltransferase